MKHSLTHDRFQGSGRSLLIYRAKTTRNGDLRQYSEICTERNAWSVRA